MGALPFCVSSDHASRMVVFSVLQASLVLFAYNKVRMLRAALRHTTCICYGSDTLAVYM